MIKVFMAIPSTGDRCDAQNYALRRMEKLYQDKIQFVYPEVLVQRIFHDFARNCYVEEFLKSDCDVMWFLDSDVSPPSNLWDEYLKNYDSWDAAGAPYPVFITPTGTTDGPQVVYTVYKRGQTGLHAASVSREGTDFVDGIATGCIMLKRKVFEKLSKPYFEFKYDAETREMTEGEDLGFCRKLNEQGYKFFIDYSKVCKHYKKVCLLDVNNYAVTYSNNNVLAYDQQIRSALVKKKLEKSNLWLPK